MKLDLYLFKDQWKGPVKWAIHRNLAKPTGSNKCHRKNLAVPEGGSRLSASLTNYNDGEAIFLSAGMNVKYLVIVEYYRPKQNSWASDAPDLKYERAGHSSCCLKDKIYVFGGVVN